MITTQLLQMTQIEEAAALLKAGETLAFPTETVYGLGADALNTQAVLKIYHAKGRPQFNPLIAHLSSAQEAFEWGLFNTQARQLAALWPAPLTLIVPLNPARKRQISDIATSGLETIGLRVPAHPLALQLLKTVNRPIVAPSANRSGHVSPTRWEHVYADLHGKIGGILQAEACAIGVESTIIACLEQPQILREGGLARETIEASIGPLNTNLPQKIIAPGMLLSHYAPEQKLRLNATHLVHGENLLAFGAPLEGAKQTLNLSFSQNLEEAAHNLFAMLRKLDQFGQPIAVMPIPSHGLGAALNDRLKRAAS